ncbi:hypothetical protein F5X99DRAFT_404633 [Biscogniauxia marginata]|nr:hypothetical protein F5X99DRAFT_404633 [Biscogniauxia marginata]
MAEINEAFGFESNPDIVSSVVSEESHLGSPTISSTTTGQTSYSSTANGTRGNINYYPNVNDSSAFAHHHLPIQWSASTFSTDTYPAYTHNDGGWILSHSPAQDDGRAVYHAAGPSPLTLPGNSYIQDLSAHRFDPSSMPMGGGTAQNVTYQADTLYWNEAPQRRWSMQVEQGSDGEADGRRSPGEPAPRKDGGSTRNLSAGEPHWHIVLSGYLNDEEAPYDGVGRRDTRRSRINSVLDARYGV